MKHSSQITTRLYQDLDDLVQMQQLLMEARAQSDDWRYAHVGDLMWLFFMVACHLDPKLHIRLWHARERLVGYAILGEDPSYDWQILPEFAWQGMEEEALVWAEVRLADLRESEPQLWDGQVMSGSRQDDGKRMEFLEKHGFRQGGAFSEVNMICSLERSIPVAVIPEGFVVREVAEAGELTTRAEIQRVVWAPWSVGKVTEDDYAYFMSLPGYHRDLDIVAVAPDGTVAAYVNGWIDPLNRVGDFGPLGARPDHRRKGLTRAVLLECFRRMQAYGMKRVSVSTGVDNAPAIALYESVGFKIVNKYLEYVKPE